VFQKTALPRVLFKAICHRLSGEFQEKEDKLRKDN
jgi:hypothetical protein